MSYLISTGSVVQSGDIAFQDEAVDDRAAVVGPVQVAFMPFGNQQTDSGSGAFGKHVRADSSGPAYQRDVFEQRIEIGITQGYGAAGQAIKQADRQVVRGSIDFAADEPIAVAENAIGKGPSNVNVDCKHGTFTAPSSFIAQYCCLSLPCPLTAFDRSQGKLSRL